MNVASERADKPGTTRGKPEANCAGIGKASGPHLARTHSPFALLVITLWTGAIILETVFNWPGIGRAYYQAIGLFDTPVIVGNTVIYAYLLAITVFFLDFIYVLVDPRVKVGGGRSS